MDNTFILRLKDKIDLKRRGLRMATRLLPPLIKTINRHNSLLKVSFGRDDLNDEFGIKSSYRFKGNMLRGQMMSVERAINIYHLLSQTIIMEVEGDVVELGCYEGMTAVLLQQTLTDHASPKAIHVYDSFAGLPEPSPWDGTRLSRGDLRASEDKLAANFARLGIPAPHVHSGWFKDTLSGQLPEKISFAHLDADLYSSVMESLVHVYPRLSRQAIVVVDDYCDPAILATHNILPGVKRACDEFLSDKPEKMNVLIAGDEAHGYFRKA